MVASKKSQNNIQQRWQRYRQRFAPTFEPLDAGISSPTSNLGLIVVIPCYDEPDVICAINSLYACTRPDCAVEVLLIINASSQDDDIIHQQNKKTLDELSAWSARFSDSAFRLHCLYNEDMPIKHQGVGLARKMGLDIAVSRFAEVANEEGVCVSLDADCLVSTNYLCEIEKHFQLKRKDEIAVVDFRHRLDEVSDSDHYEAMIAYELYLRYYVQGVRYAGLPYGYHTLGSCFAVRAKAYMAQGGMNKRQGGEDFYFIHKFTSLAQCGRLQTAQVMPSARLSERVPFGTGPSVLRWANMRSVDYETYDPQVFRDLRCLVDWLESLDNQSDFNIDGLRSLPNMLLEFLTSQGVAQRIEEIRANTASLTTSIERFIRWFNAFLILKYIHYAHDRCYQHQPLLESSQTMLAMVDGGQVANTGLVGLLDHYRQCDLKKVK